MKNKYSYVGIALIVLLFGAFVVRNYKHHLEPRNRTTQEQKEEELNPSGLTYFEIDHKARKMPDFVFTDQNNQTISNVDYNGKVFVVEFFFTTCPSICPIMNRNMLTIEKEFGKRDDFGIASFTINPTVDTPIKLKEYAENYGVTSLNWHFLTGDRETIYEMANKGLNIFAELNPEVEGGFEHQGFFALVDKNGFLRSRKDPYGNPKIYYQGTDEKEVALLIEDIQLLLENE
ncbi:SCO family protein [Wenyingzhuangia sp. 2_MG-2023]|uniref:SCO family protein n=1 Tax=Wenyingzhuangia sp. 2_MG-2023 TaxID=3062639 RepID=UPI0026E41D59|nr:SCO family protein [Wenyingzhuangia sp. 2_MG-2023]MDO6736236.1 SCO family protein [Wenyingzhuangia sp. 2_MG-2023]MDO6801460.1 SCO family protein [Wenyingzhuangia sp. 1_MG-2023]